MSLILEALKKSEAKRRLGEAPDLGTPFATPRRRGRVLPLLVLAIIAAGALGWWLLRQPTPAGTATTSGSAQKTAAAPSPVVAKPVVPAPTARPAVAQNTAAAAPQPKPVAAEPRPTMPSAQTEASPWVAVGKPDNRRATAPAPRKLPPNMHRVEPATQVADNPSAPGGAKTANGQPPQPVAPNTPVLAKAAKTPDMRGLTPPPAPPAPEATPAPKTAEPTSAAGQSTPPVAVTKDVPFYYELPFNVRKTLPPLRLSMHVYAGDPAQRFVVLNDSRLAEGDKTADDVTLREVRKDGAVLEFQGQRFFYPRDGY